MGKKKDEKKKEKELIEIKLIAPTKDTPISEIVSREKLDEAVSKLATKGREILWLEVERDKKIAEIKTDYGGKIDALKLSAKTFFEAIVRYCCNNRQDLLPPDRKSVELTNGTIGWQLNPSSLKLTVDEEMAVAYLKENGHAELIRTKEVVDLEALKKLPELARTIPIVEYNEGAEYFFTQPHGVQVSFMRRMKALAQKVTDKSKQIL